MVSFGIEYKEAINAMISDRSNNLRKFELEEAEWDIAAELAELLEVCVFLLIALSLL